MDCSPPVMDRLLCPWDPPDKNTGVGRRSFLQGVFRLRDWTCSSSVPCTSRQAPLHQRRQESPSVFVVKCWRLGDHGGPALGLSVCLPTSLSRRVRVSVLPRSWESRDSWGGRRLGPRSSVQLCTDHWARPGLSNELGPERHGHGRSRRTTIALSPESPSQGQWRPFFTPLSLKQVDAH